MRHHTQTRCKYKELPLRFERRGHDIQCGRLIVLGLLTILFAALTQSGCVGLTSAGNPFSKSSSSSTSTNSIPSITTSPLSNAQLGILFQASLTAAGGVQPYVWSIASRKLPPGISLNAASGMLSGTPSQGGQFDFSVQVSDSSSPTPQTAMKALTLSVLAFTLQISPGKLPSGQVGIPFRATLTGNGGVRQYTWTITGALPSGLTLNSSSGAITGTPLVAGTSTITLYLADSTGETARTASSITIAAVGTARTPVISPVQPVVQPGGTQQFTITSNPGTGGTYTCANISNGGACLGSITTGGLYTAPNTIAANQSLGGYQLLPNDHIFNTNIASLPASTGGETFRIAASPVGAVRSNGIATIRFSPVTVLAVGTPVTITGVGDSSFDGIVTVLSTGCSNTCFTYANIGPNTTSGNGNLFVPFASGMGTVPMNYLPSMPINYANASTPTDNMVFYYTPTNNGTYQSPQWPDANIQGGWFDARANSPNIDHHMIVIDTTTGNLNERYQYYPIRTNRTCPSCNSQSGIKYSFADYALPTKGATDAASLMIAPLVLHSQEVATACANGGAIKHALRMTVANGYIKHASVWPASPEGYGGGGINPYGQRFRLKADYDISGFSPCAQVLLTQLKNYGLILVDGGYGWQVTTDFDNSPSVPSAAMKEINTAAIPVANWDVVDESSLMESPYSGAASNGEVVTYTSSAGSVSTNVNLQGTAVNVNTNQYYIMAGTPPQQLIGYSNGPVTWSMSPTVGTLTTGGLYTAPTSVPTMTTTTVTVTSTVNPAVSAHMIVYVLPSTNFRLTQGTTSYTDSHGNVWYAGYGIGLSNGPSLQGCCQTDGLFPNITDKQLWWNHYASSQTQGDMKIDFHVPSGVYAVIFYNGTIVPAGADVRHIYAQGSLIETIDATVLAGGMHLPYTLSANVTVGSNNTLSIYIAGIGNQSNNEGDISSIQIMQTGN